MNGLQFVASIVSTLAWPVVLATALFVFRAPIAKQIERVKFAKGPGGFEAEFDFEGRAEGAREDAQAAGEAIAARVGADTRVVAAPAEIDHAAEPTFSVIAAWARVEAAVSTLTIAAELPVEYASTTGLSKRLHHAGIVNLRFVDSVRELAMLRNAVAHGHRQVSIDEAKVYVEAANELVRACGVILDFRILPPRSPDSPKP